MILEAVKPTEMSLSAMAAEYNVLAAPLGKTPVKKFADRATAERRLAALRVEVATQGYAPEDINVAEQAELNELVEKYNRLANVIEEPTVESFASVAGAKDRVAAIEARVQDHYAAATPTTKRQKCFNYPPLAELKTLKSGTLRAEARDMLLKGATVARIEQLVADWDVKQGKTPHRLEPRAYGLIRLLNNYIGYALREEGVGTNKVIYAMTREDWEAWKLASRKIAA